MEDNSVDDLTEFPNLEQSRRFHILRDIIVQPKQLIATIRDTGPALHDAGSDSHVVYNMKLNLPVEYDGTSATPSVSEIVSNSLTLFAVSNTTPTVNMAARIRFEA